MGKTKISASLMCANQLEIIKYVTSLSKLGVDYFHLDVMDGNFVNNLALNLDIIKAIRPLTSIPFDVHLMVQEPSKYFDRLIEYGVDIIIFHVECSEDIQKNIDYLKSKKVGVGLSLHLQTPLAAVEKYLPHVNYILLMNVKTGYSGLNFDPIIYQKIDKLYSYIKNNKLDIMIISDGGIKLDHIKPLYNKGIDMIVAGTSLLFNKNGLSNNLEIFRNIELNENDRSVQPYNPEDSQIVYKVAVLMDVNNFYIAERKLRELKENEVVVKVMSCGICGSDIVRVFKKGMYSRDLVPGHEMSGIVIKTNEKDSELLNKPVAIFPLMPCHKCTYCKLEKYNLCENYNYLGSRTDGGFAELIIAPKENLIPIPNNVSYDEAALLEPMAVTHHGVKKLPNLPNSKVLVLGLGPIGILAGMFCKKFGATKVVGIEIDAHKRLLATTVGFSQTYKPETFKDKETEFDIIIDACGVTDALGNYIQCLKKEGSILLLANYENGLSMSSSTMSRILRGEIKMFSTWNSNISDLFENDWKISVDYLAKMELNIKPLITHNFPLIEIVQTFNIINNKEIDYLKVIINPNMN